MPIPDSRLLKALKAIRNQLDTHGTSRVRLEEVARGPYGPDDDEQLRVRAHRLQREGYLDVQQKVTLTQDGVKAARGQLDQKEDSAVSTRESFDSRSPFSQSWLAQQEEVPLDTAVISGNIPFRRGTLTTYLEDQFDVDVGRIGEEPENPELLILGRYNHEEGVVEPFLDNQRGTPLRICSQEMILSWIYTGFDPNRYRESLPQFIEGHPALERVRDILEARWPKPGEGLPSVSPGTGGNVFETEVEEGPLRRSGYQVGETGETESTRQEVLKEVLTKPREEFPGTYPLGYLDKWGKPESGMRLEKIARSIATFCRNRKKMSNPSEQAINDWERDLEWLKRNFFNPVHFGFDWPSTRPNRN